MRRFGILVTATVLVVLSAVSAEAALIFYNSRATFEGATSSLTTETFEDANFLPGGVACPAPADATTANACFDPGDIEAGLVVTTEGPFSGNAEALILIPSGFAGITSGTVFANIFADILSLQFTGSANAVGFNAYHLFEPSLVTISVFGTSGLLGTLDVNVTNTGDGTFFGVTSDESIARITLSSATQVAEGVNNVSFGTAAVPEPATVVLLGTAVLGCGMRRWRQRRH